MQAQAERTRRLVRDPTAWSTHPTFDPNHLGMRCNALPAHQMAPITSGCATLQTPSDRKLVSAAAALQASHGLQLQSLWRIPAAAVWPTRIRAAPQASAARRRRAASRSVAESPATSASSLSTAVRPDRQPAVPCKAVPCKAVPCKAVRDRGSAVLLAVGKAKATDRWGRHFGRCLGSDGRARPQIDPETLPPNTMALITSGCG